MSKVDGKVERETSSELECRKAVRLIASRICKPPQRGEELLECVSTILLHISSAASVSRPVDSCHMIYRPYVNELLRGKTPVCFVTHPDQRWELLEVPRK